MVGHCVRRYQETTRDARAASQDLAGKVPGSPTRSSNLPKSPCVSKRVPGAAAGRVPTLK